MIFSKVALALASVRKASSCLEVTPDSFVTVQIITELALEVIFGGQALLREVNYGLELFFQSVDGGAQTLYRWFCNLL